MMVMPNLPFPRMPGAFPACVLPRCLPLAFACRERGPQAPPSVEFTLTPAHLAFQRLRSPAGWSRFVRFTGKVPGSRPAGATERPS